MALFRPFDNGMLPAEMVELIAQNLAQEDLGSFRQASRMCAAGVSKVFEQYIRCLRVRLATESSIANAIKIVTQPDLGAAVQELLLVDNLAERPEWYDFSVDWSGSELPLEQSTATLARAHTVYHQQRSMRQSGSDRCLLTELFKKSAQIGVKKIVFESRNHGGWDDDGHWDEDLQKDLVVEEWWWESYDSHCFTTVMFAVVDSGSTFDTFRMRAGDGCGIPMRQFGDFETGRTCEAALSRFKHIRLSLNVAWGSIAERKFIFMIAELRICSLEIVLESYETLRYGDPPALDTVLDQEFPYIKVLEFGDMIISWRSLAPFLKRNESLRELIFVRTTVRDVPRDLAGEERCSERSHALGIPKVIETGAQFLSI
ncbi:unnamed protein product [Zymoseptoria tritici ST99CH_3D1]|uniref:F-box domain-containing protein n=1 Tax=Zymoseptoria tritici (strain ST99CH_3D7) TaxID=1276538 RepID=A0A1X7SA79_ZYMT9|nr:unnamed protein product [Zymoseptoria tritici ST99CH_3D7]SMR64469.1 unnamed protein product [Zymoseptoria tritici ST99CH_3D1]